MSRIAVSQICKSIVGFNGAQSSVIDTLTLITTKYLQSLAKTALSFSNSANRSEPNLFDIVNGLNELTLSKQGFFNGSLTRRSDHDDCLLMSSAGVVNEIIDFVRSTNEIPFVKPFPRQRKDYVFRVLDRNVSSDRCRDRDRDKLYMHIPKWLPSFPEQIGNGESSEGARIGREKLWEESDNVVMSGNGGCVADSVDDSDNVVMMSKAGRLESSVSACVADRGNCGDLPMERAKVRFKIGGGRRQGGNKGSVNVRNGMCRGGKRVCWNSNGDKENDSKIKENQEKLGGGGDGRTNDSKRVILLTYKRRKKMTS
ncbi:hypothetical protein ACFE04_030774 [Oxalis oulophora]